MQPWLGLTYLLWLQTYGMPTALDWLKKHVLEDWCSVSHICLGLLLWLGPSSSNQATYLLMTSDTWMVTFRLLSGSMELTPAGRGEIRAEVCCINQMVWHLNMLPSGMPSLKDVNLDILDSFPLSMGPEERRACPRYTKQCPQHIH